MDGLDELGWCNALYMYGKCVGRGEGGGFGPEQTSGFGEGAGARGGGWSALAELSDTPAADVSLTAIERTILQGRGSALYL